MNVLDLIKSANAPEGDVYDGSLLNEVFADVATQIEQDQKQQRVATVKNLVEGFYKALQGKVQNLRKLREEEAKAAAGVKALDLAFKYFAHSGNPLPMFKAMGNMGHGENWCRQAKRDVPKHDSPEWDVPKTFKPKK